MRSLDFSRCALTSCVATAMLAGCGGSQPPIGAAAAMPQTSGIATHADRGKSWMLEEATSEDLIYATGGCGYTCVLSYPNGKLVGTLAATGVGLCSDEQGNVFFPDGSTVTEYAHGGTNPIATLYLPGSEAHNCSVDPVTNNLAVPFGSSGSNVAIFPNETGTPTLFDSPVGPLYCGYDGSGNLFVDGEANNNYAIAELPYGGTLFSQLSIEQSVGQPGQLQWDGSYITYEAVNYGAVKISRLSISGSEATIAGTTKLETLNRGAQESVIFSGKVIVPHPLRSGRSNVISLFKYPKGGKPFQTIRRIGDFKKRAISFYGLTVSIAPSR
jgi:hypothetical protein